MPVGDAASRRHLRLLTPFLNITGRVRADPRGRLQHVRVHAEASRAALLARPEPARRPVPVQPAHRAGGDRRQPRRVAAGDGRGRWPTGRIHSRVPATILIAIGAFIPTITDSLNRFGSTELFQLGQVPGRGVPVRSASSSRSRSSARSGSRSRDPPRRLAARVAAAPVRGRDRRGRRTDLAARRDARISDGPRRLDRPAALPWRGCPARPSDLAAPRLDGRGRATRPCRSAGSRIVIGSAALFGMLGPLSRFAYEAGMEPPAFVAWRALIGFLGVWAPTSAWRVRRGATRLVRLGDLPLRARVVAPRRGRRRFTLNLCMFIAFDRHHDRAGAARLLHVPGDGRGRERRPRSGAAGRQPGRWRSRSAIVGHGRGRRLAARSGGGIRLDAIGIGAGARRGRQPDDLRDRQPRRLPGGPDRAGDDDRARGDSRRGSARSRSPSWPAASAVARPAAGAARTSCRCCCSPASSPRRSRRSGS